MKSGSHLERVLTGGHFAVTGELGPPKNGDPEIVREKARILKGHVDAVNITDCQTAIVRMSSIAAGLITQSEGVEPVIQMTCRDRNRIGMQSDILGAAALGLKNLLCLTGDHQKFGNHPGSKGVFDMDSIQLLTMMKGMRDDKQFQCGEAIKASEPRLFLGAAANPFAGPTPAFRAQRLGKKFSAGSDFVQTQIIYNVEKFAEFMKVVCDLGLDEKMHILAGVTPPKSLGMARYMKKFVPGMDVTDDVIKRLQAADDMEDEGINICVDVINQVREIKGVAGVHVMAIEWETAVPEIVSRAGLAERPTFEDEPVVGGVSSETIVVRSGAGGADDINVLAQAKDEARKIIAVAREKAKEMIADPSGADQIADAGEDEMNEKERQLALESVRLGLESLKKMLNLTDDQFEAISKFAGAEVVLGRDPQLGSVPAAPAAAPATPAAPAAPVADDSAKKEAEAKAAEEAKKAAEAKAAADAKAADEAKKAAEAKPAETKVAEPKKAAPAAKPAATGSVTVAELAVESTKLADRSSKVPADHYTNQYTGNIRESVLGNDDSALTVGGGSSLPFHLFEGDMPRQPIIAMEIPDVKPEEWPEPLAAHFADVMDDQAAWAKKCVNEFGAEALCVSMVSTDPNGMNRSAADAAKVAADVINAVDVPVIIWGCGNAEKDTETLREVTSLVGDKKVCLAPLSDANYRSIGATAMAFQHPMVASSPIDVNLAKQLNILLETMGVNLDTVLIDPSIGALGYGIEYTYSVMERIRLAALTQKDEKLQVPFICNLGREVWKAKETKLPSDDMIGDQEQRGVMMEAITASCMLMAGGEVLIMRHPKAIALTKSLVKGLMG